MQNKNTDTIHNAPCVEERSTFLQKNTPSRFSTFLQKKTLPYFISCLELHHVEDGPQNRVHLGIIRAQFTSLLQRNSDIAHEIDTGPQSYFQLDTKSGCFGQALLSQHSTGVSIHKGPPQQPGPQQIILQPKCNMQFMTTTFKVLNDGPEAKQI